MDANTDAITEFRGLYRFLSNFFEHDGRITAEHLFQSMKTTDPFSQLWILAAPGPGEAKRRGRNMSIRSDWDDVKVGVMECVIAIKFPSGSYCARLLEETGDRELIEGNWWGDKFWGAMWDKELGWVGHNNLGQLLMERREKNREGL